MDRESAAGAPGLHSIAVRRTSGLCRQDLTQMTSPFFSEQYQAVNCWSRSGQVNIKAASSVIRCRKMTLVYIQSFTEDVK